MLSFYLAFLYADRPYYNEFLDRILCMSKFLFDVQQKNRLEQKGLLKRFSITCYGHQETVEEMRAHKSEKYKELKSMPGKNKEEYEEWFLSYKPEELNQPNRESTDTASSSNKISKLKRKLLTKTTKKANTKTKKKITRKNKFFPFRLYTKRKRGQLY
jgi:hypothetical protein